MTQKGRLGNIKVGNIKGDWSKKKKIDCFLRRSLNQLLFGNGEYTQNFYSLFFCVTREDIRKSLEKSFVEDMCWDNYGSWHIDHLTPCSWFYYETLQDGEVWHCWHPDNLKPKWKKDNYKKSGFFSDQIQETFSKTIDVYEKR